ncbi:hypothetical protein EI94DRAFT_1749868 [Lactarius quietus]|nr:hypothetical protein EI94DRAFT_1749868 [Lactarius quietus]
MQANFASYGDSLHAPLFQLQILDPDFSFLIVTIDAPLYYCSTCLSICDRFFLHTFPSLC